MRAAVRSLRGFHCYVRLQFVYFCLFHDGDVMVAFALFHDGDVMM
jgi:hypothetical protein